MCVLDGICENERESIHFFIVTLYRKKKINMGKYDSGNGR